MNVSKLYKKWQRQRELSKWLRRERRRRIRPLPLSDWIQRDLNLQAPASAPLGSQPTADRRNRERLAAPIFGVIGGLS